VTQKSDFSAQEWDLVREGPPSAALIVITAQRGGSIREVFAMAKAYAEARQHHGESELLDEIVSARPEVDHTRYHSFEELRDAELGHLRDAVALLETKANAGAVDDYRRFVLNVANTVAGAHREGGTDVSDNERAAIDEITSAVGISSG
jgi:hypothetical protein